jgi:hypothetical protein
MKAGRLVFVRAAAGLSDTDVQTLYRQYLRASPVAPSADVSALLPESLLLEP